MKKALEKVFEQASQLPLERQETLAAILAEEMRAEHGWQERFNDPRSDRVLSELADEALEEHRRGQTRQMNPDEL